MGIAQLIEARTRDLGGFTVGRVLPHHGGQGVGPFVFFDHMGPASFAPGNGGDVRPHPHIGLATVTWLFEGEIMHRDSVGSRQAIHPGDVNWMTAGRGIVHSERIAPEARERGVTLHGIQAWLALPRASEEAEPDFVHFPAASLPRVDRDGVKLRLIAGSGWGLTAPARIFSPLFYAEARLEAGARLMLPGEHTERACYLVEGAARVAGTPLAPRHMAVARPGAAVAVDADAPSMLMLLGGEPLGERHLWWNFVSSSKARIEQAKADWKAGRFAPVPGETEFIPLPEN